MKEMQILQKHKDLLTANEAVEWQRSVSFTVTTTLTMFLVCPIMIMQAIRMRNGDPIKRRAYFIRAILAQFALFGLQIYAGRQMGK